MTQSSAQQNSERPIVAVIGNGWSAMGAVGFLATAGYPVKWILGSGARIDPPLPTLEASLDVGSGMALWKELLDRLGIEAGEIQTGVYLREFRNKSFREPVWSKAPTPEQRREVQREVLWAPECRLSGVFEARFQTDLITLEELIRERLSQLPNIQKIDALPITEIKQSPLRVVLGSGQEIACDRVIYADRWVELSKIAGLPKPAPFARHREPAGVLQARFKHQPPLSAGLMEGFYCPVHKEAGEETQRNLWGYILGDGHQSVWTFLIAGEETEDNHEIAKRFRRMKQALDRMFADSSFMSTVQDEQVRFAEAMIFGAGDPPTHPIHLAKVPGIAFLTDGYGPADSLRQVGILLGEELELSSMKPGASAKTKGVDLGHTS